MTDTEEGRLEVIRKLLAQAESTTHPAEAETFVAKAQELMTRWAIDDEMLEASKHLDEAAGEIGSELLLIDANEYRAPKINLLNTVAQANSSRIILMGKQTYVPDSSRPQGRRRVQKVELIGYGRDRAFVQMLWTSLLTQAEHEFNLPKQQESMRRQMNTFEPNKRGGFRIRWHNTFMTGFVSGVGLNLARSRQATVKNVDGEASSDTTTLVLASRSARVDAALADMHPRLGKASRSSAGQGPGSAWAGGRAAGERADLGGRGRLANKPALSDGKY